MARNDNNGRIPPEGSDYNNLFDFDPEKINVSEDDSRINRFNSGNQKEFDQESFVSNDEQSDDNQSTRRLTGLPGEIRGAGTESGRPVSRNGRQFAYAARRSSGRERQAGKRAAPAKGGVSAVGRKTREPRDDVPHRRIGGVFGAILYFIFIVGISSLLAAFIWVSANDVLGLVKPESVAEITVEEGDTLRDISAKLKEQGIIEYPWLFNLYGNFSDAEEKIDPGKYNINSTFDYRAIVSAMSNRSQFRATVWVTIPEGYELKQIYTLLEQRGVCKYNEIKEVADTYPFKHSFLQDVPMEENRLEGFLFPDTYEFYVNEKPVNVLNVMLLAFGKRFNEDLQKRAGDLGLSIREVVTLASLIEKEAALDSERSLISSVIHNRLKSSKYPFLNIDATIQYILPERKEKLSAADTQIDNPYNTYLYKGLPPGPIANPGIASIKAALYPEDTKYYFYALDQGGAHKFSKTLEEHNNFLVSKNKQ